MGYSEPQVIPQYTITNPLLSKVKKSQYFGTTPIRSVVPGGDFCLFIDGKNKHMEYLFCVEESRLYSLGSNSGHYALSNSEVDIIPVPTIVPALEKIAIKEASVGWGHVLALGSMFFRIIFSVIDFNV